MTKLSLTLITGRSTKQGTGISVGKESPEYQEATHAVELNKSDMARFGLRDGDQVRLTTEFGTVAVKCRRADVPEGLAFMAYGPACNRLVGSETYGSGMPDSKNIRVEIIFTAEAQSSQSSYIISSTFPGPARRSRDRAPRLCGEICVFSVWSVIEKGRLFSF